MKARIEKGSIILNLCDVLDQLDDESKDSLIEQLSCDQDITKRVADQIFDGWTERSSHGPVFVTAAENPTTGLDYAMRRFSKLDQLAKKEIERLEESLKHKSNQLIEAYKRIDELKFGGD